MFDLQGKSALLTGATGGLGADIARILREQGVRLFLTGTRADALNALAAELGDACHALPCDLHDPENIKSLAKTAEEALDGVDILVNNAAITRDTLAMRMSDAHWNEVVAVNLNAPFLLTRALLRPMVKRRHGRILFVSSVVGTTGNPGQANYAAAKSALSGMAKSIALEVANYGITVNCIAPGFMRSPMTDALDDKQKDAILTRIPAKRMGSGADVAAAVAYLASDEAAYVTGQTFHINGGLAMI